MTGKISKKVFGFALAALLSALSIPAHTQQTGKIFHIGFLDGSTASGMAVLVDAFRQELSKLGWIEGSRLGVSLSNLANLFERPGIWPAE